MKKIHVCLVSDQTVPNILAIHQFQPDELLFITTPKMEKLEKTDHMLAALKSVGCDYSTAAGTITVSEDSILDIHRKLEQWVAGREDAEFVVNLTCGTKIMSIAAYEFFKEYGARMIYIPLGKNEFITLFPKRYADREEPLPLRLSVADYLAAYGLRVVNGNSIRKGEGDAARRRELSDWIAANYQSVKPLLERFGEKLRRHRDDREGYTLTTSYLPGTDEERQLLQQLGFAHENGTFTRHLTKSEIGFLTGGWLEEFCFNAVADLIGKGIDDAALGIKIMNANGRDNEFDVMFTRDNVLYTIECKSLDQNDDPRADALYKIAALQKDFGLRVESFFVSTSPHILRDGKLKPAIAARAEQFRTTVIPPHEVIHFASRLKEKLRIEESPNA